MDVLLRAQLFDPDGIPGNGDEYYQSVESGGVEVTLGEGVLRKQKLDTAFRASRQITF